MNSGEETIIKHEAKERLRSLKEYSARRREWYQDVNIKIADKQLEHLISISSISAAIIALTVAFQIQKNFWLELSFWALIVTVVLGTTLALLLIIYNKIAIDYTKGIELTIIDNLKKSTDAVIQHPERYERHYQDFAQEITKIEKLPDMYSFRRKVLEHFYYLVLLAFVLGILGLVGAWVTNDSVVFKTNQSSKISAEYDNIRNQDYMNSLIILSILFLISVILGFIKYGSLSSSYKGKPWQLKFIEIWNGFVSFFIAGLIGYYFVLIRLPLLSKGEALNISDFALLIFLAVSLFGHLPILSKNITEGIQAILKRVLEGR